MSDEAFMQQAETEDQTDLTSHLIRLAEQAEGTFWSTLGCEVVQATQQKTTIRLHAGAEHLNLFGIVHGGVLMSILDNAMGLVAICSAPGRRVVTANMNTQFLASARSGMLYCEAEFIHTTERTLTLQATVKDEDGRLLAWGSGAYRLLSEKAER